MSKRLYFIGGGLVAIIALALLTLVIARPGSEPEQDSTALAANKLYESGYYAEAARLYEQLAAQGNEDSRLFYNLGNAYSEQGRMPQAWAAFEKANALSPRDPEIRARLVHAREYVGLPANPKSHGTFASLVDFTARWLTRDELAIFALGSWLLLGLLFVLWRGVSNASVLELVRPALVVTFIFVALSGIALFGQMAADDQPRAMPAPSQLVETVSTPGT
ncbi:MAG: tetratricopeptide repeat protein [Caldilineales bacterium]|nr:tetratricopeptide repeat protein [Caldilineales bacterium]